MSNSSNHIISGASVTNNSIGSEIQSSSSEEMIISRLPGDDTLYINRGVVVTNLSNVYITSGMSVNSLNISSAAMYVREGGYVNSATITDGIQYLYGGTATNISLLGSGAFQRVVSGIASNINFDGGQYSGQQEVWNGSVVNTSFNIGTQYISGGTVVHTKFQKDGCQGVYGGVASDTSIFDGFQRVLGGVVIDTYIQSGDQYVDAGSAFNNTIINGRHFISAGVVSNTHLSNYTSQYISGGEVYDTFINTGLQRIYSGVVSNTSLTNHANQYVYGGSVYSTFVNDGNQYVYGGSVYSTFINDGNQYVLSGKVNETTINSGTQFVRDGASAYSTVVGNLGSQFLSSGASADYTTVINGGVQLVSTGAIVNYTTVSDTAVQSVLSGGSVDHTTIISGGIQLVSSGAVVNNTSILGSVGGNVRTSQTLLSGGIASNTVISGGYQNINSGAVANNTTITDGAVYADDGATVSNVIINNGGWLDVGLGTNIQGEVTLNPGGSALITTSNGGVVNLVGDDNGGLTIVGEPPLVNWEGNNASVTTQIQGFSGTDASHSDGILLQYEDIETGKLSNVTFPDNDHITLTMDTGFALTLNIVGIKQTGYSIKESTDGVSGLILTVCFLSGTQIKTKLGVKNIEALRAGDFVTTYDWVQKKYVEREVTWVGKKYCRVNTSLPDDMAGYPVRIVKDAIAKGVPYKDLLVTAEHCLFFEDKFIPSRMLVNGSTIYYDYSITSYEYYHLETQDHAVIIADGVRTESYLDTGNRHAFNRDHKVIETSFQSVKDWEVDAAAPLVVAQDVVEPLYNKLNKRAQRLKVDYKGRHVQLVNDSDLHLVTDQGQVIRNKRVSGEWVTFMVPSTVESVWINSRRSRLCDVIGPFVDNRHFLGVLVGEVMIFADNKNEFSNILREEEELEGWHAKEKKAGRWTKGRALLPIKSKHLVDNSVIYISLQILSEGPYVELVTEAEDEITLVG